MPPVLPFKSLAIRELDVLVDRLQQLTDQVAQTTADLTVEIDLNRSCSIEFAF
jgi:hypothetical protein